MQTLSLVEVFIAIILAFLQASYLKTKLNGEFLLATAIVMNPQLLTALPETLWRHE